MSIFYQFANYFNFYFLVSTIIFSIPQVSSITPSASIGPFAVLILISIIREAFEDYKKSKYDKVYNNSKCLKYENGVLTERKWKDINVGDIIRVLKNEEIPADLIIFKSSNEHGYSYLETKNIDGETALKVKESIGNSKDYFSDNFINFRADLTVDTPNKDIYAFSGKLIVKKENNEEIKIFLKPDNMLLRTGKLKNVEWNDGIVIYTGQDTKIMQNMKKYSYKLSFISRKINVLVIYILIFVLLLCTICTIFGNFFRSSNLPDYNDRSKTNAEYIYYYDKDSNSSDAVMELLKYHK